MRLNPVRLCAFAAMAMPLYAVQVPLNVYLPAIFAQHFGIPLTIVGLIFLIEKLWGTLADPLIGVLSDRTSIRFGRRRSWIAAGGVVFAVAGVLLFFPQGAVTPVYLGVVLFAFYLGWSMMQIPYLAWSGEISGGYHERTRIATYQTVAGAAASLLVLTLPTIVDQFWPRDFALKLGAIGGLLLAMLVLGLALALRAFPEPPLPRQLPIPLSLTKTAKLILGNRLLQQIFAADFAVTLGQSIRAALFVFFVSQYVGLPQWASGLFLLQFTFGIAAGPIWMKVGYRLGKNRAAVAAELVQLVVNLGLLLVMPGQLPLLLALTIAQGLAQNSGNLMLRSMVADVADQHRLQTKQDRTALFFSLFSISSKAAMATAFGVALPLVAWLGFDPSAAHNSPAALRGLIGVFALGPALAHLAAATLVYRFPLDAAAHAQIRRQLDARDGKPVDVPPTISKVATGKRAPI